MGRGADPVPAPSRPNPQPGRHRAGLRAAGARGADRGDPGASERHPGQGRRLDPDRPGRLRAATSRRRTGWSGVLGRLLAITENYPDLKSNANFLALQSQLEGTENRIAIARRDYNEAVRVFNTTLRTFPGIALGQDGLSAARSRCRCSPPPRPPRPRPRSSSTSGRRRRRPRPLHGATPPAAPAPAKP